MATVNLHTQYKEPLVHAFEYSSQLSGKFTNKYTWTGVKTIVLTNIVTDSLTDYSRTNNPIATSRYGTPSEVCDEQQVLVLQKDRSYTKTVDKGNYQEANYLKTGAEVVKAQMDEQVAPEYEKFVLAELAANAGKVIGHAAAPTTSTILSDLADIEVAFDDARVPKTDRFVAIANKYIAMFRQSLTNCDDITDRMLLKGIVGMFGSLHIMGYSESDLPTNCWAIAWQKESACAPKTIEDTKISNDVPGLSGMLVEARFRYGAFVVGKRNAGVIILVDSTYKCAAPTATKSTTTSSMASTTASASIYYTLDGSDPRYSSTAVLYTEAITNPAAGTILKMVAKKANMFASDVTTHTCA